MSRRHLLPLLALAFMPVTTAAQPPEQLAAWKPIVLLAGDGEPAAAVFEIERMMAAVDAMVAGLTVDPRTQQFADDVRKDLRSFDLKDFYRALPDAEATPPWRRLLVAGRVDDGQYRVDRMPDPVSWQTALAPLGDARTESLALLRARPVEVGKSTNYLLYSRAAFTLGKLQWRNVIEALADLLLLPTRYATALSDPPIDGVAAPVEAALRQLGAGFPELRAQLDKFAELDTVSLEGPPGLPWYCATGSGHANIEALEDDYPEIADFLDDLDELAKIRIQWLDPKGRALYDTTIDTRAPSVSFRFCSRDGVLLPFSGRTVYQDEPVDPWGKALSHTRAVVDAHFKVLGLEIDLARLPVDLHYTPTPARMSATIQATELPTITVSGYALGFISPKLIDLFIPGNIQSIATDFARAALKGNNGNGVVAGAGFGPLAPDRFAVIDAGADFEALNNFMVKFAVRAGLKRFLPDKDARADLGRFLRDSREAFRRDLNTFASTVALGGT